MEPDVEFSKDFKTAFKNTFKEIKENIVLMNVQGISKAETEKHK